MLVSDRAYDLVLLHDRGFVRARATGQDITQVHAELENMLHVPVRTVVKPGCYFRSTGQHQNMATTRFYEVHLGPGEVRAITIDAACIDADRPIPTSDHGFEGVARVGDDLARFLTASQGSDPMTVQAGVWAISDGMTAYAVQERLVSRGRDGVGRHAIQDRHVEEARRILRRLGVETHL